MNTPIQDAHRPEPGDDNLPQAEIIENSANFDGTKILILQVSIDGRPRKFALALNAINAYGMAGPAAVEELRQIKEILDERLPLLNSACA